MTADLIDIGHAFTRFQRAISVPSVLNMMIEPFFNSTGDRFNLGPLQLANGVTKAEISELITHLALYSGWPAAMSAARVVKQVFEEKKG